MHQNHNSHNIKFTIMNLTIIISYLFNYYVLRYKLIPGNIDHKTFCVLTLNLHRNVSVSVVFQTIPLKVPVDL